MKFRKSMKTAVVSAMATAVAFGGIEVASAITSTSEIKVCADMRTGMMRYTTKSCKKSETAIILNKQGQPGLPGPVGPKGETGAKGDIGSVGPADTKITELHICGAGGSSICKVGAQGPGGGIIFFVDSDDVYPGFNYLEAAPNGWGDGIAVNAGESTGTATGDPRLKFCGGTPDLNLDAPSSWALGAGAANTATADTDVTCISGAVQAASNYVSAIGGKADWFLPSASELQLMATNMLFLGTGGLVDDQYSSSTERDGAQIVTWWPYWGYFDSQSKSDVPYVRPIRSF